MQIIVCNKTVHAIKLPYSMEKKMETSTHKSVDVRIIMSNTLCCYKINEQNSRKKTHTHKYTYTYIHVLLNVDEKMNST